ncbi:MAG: DoxX family membrane protein [Acidobacteria bacterium]|nr:DoxX family membrane protein [Acidobacteriota bacterium]
MNDFNARLNSSWWALRLCLGGAAFLAGLDKYFNILADWQAYLSPVVTQVLPVSGAVFMALVGIIEMIVGLAILTRWTKVGSYIAMAWLVAIALNLLMTGRFFDVAVRDVAMAIAAFTLARLTESREGATESGTAYVPHGAGSRA